MKLNKLKFLAFLKRYWRKNRGKILGLITGCLLFAGTFVMRTGKVVVKQADTVTKEAIQQSAKQIDEIPEIGEYLLSSFDTYFKGYSLENSKNGTEDRFELKEKIMGELKSCYDHNNEMQIKEVIKYCHESIKQFYLALGDEKALKLMDEPGISSYLNEVNEFKKFAGLLISSPNDETFEKRWLEKVNNGTYLGNAMKVNPELYNSLKRRYVLTKLLKFHRKKADSIKAAN